MKVKLKFDLSNPIDRIKYERVKDSINMDLALKEILNLRKECYKQVSKNNLQGPNYEGIDMMSKGIWDILEKYDINTNEIL